MGPSGGIDKVWGPGGRSFPKLGSTPTVRPFGRPAFAPRRRSPMPRPGRNVDVSAKIEALRRRHAEYEAQLEAYAKRHYLSEAEQAEVRRLKRLKLYAKDEIRRYSRGNA